MSKEKYGVKECIEVIKANGVYNPNIQKYFDELEKILTEYEAIDNANPSEALETLDFIGNLIIPTASGNKYLKDFCDKEFDTIKQVLLKAQEQEEDIIHYKGTVANLRRDNALLKELNAELRQKAQDTKHYLKWEDLEFKENNQRIKVKLGSNIYTLDFYIGQFGKTFVLNLQHYCEAKDNKQFFNDLHLERVEE